MVQKTLEKAKDQGVIAGFNQQPFGLDFINKDMPYFEGDVWPRELEDYYKALDDVNTADEIAEVSQWSHMSQYAAKVGVVLLL